MDSIDIWLLFACRYPGFAWVVINISNALQSNGRVYSCTWKVLGLLDPRKYIPSLYMWPPIALLVWEFFNQLYRLSSEDNHEHKNPISDLLAWLLSQKRTVISLSHPGCVSIGVKDFKIVSKVSFYQGICSILFSSAEIN